MKKEENKKNIWFAIGRFVFGLVLASFLFIVSKIFQFPITLYFILPIIVGLYFMLTKRFRIRLDATLLIIAIIFIGLSINSSYKIKPLLDAECAKFVDCKISDIQFGPSKSEFSVNSEIYPAVTIAKGARACGKQMAVLLLDDKDNKIFGEAYNSPPTGEGGQTGYGNYNPGKNLTAGSYNIECYYGDAFVKKIQIIIK